MKDFCINEPVASRAIAELGLKLPVHVSLPKRLGAGVKADTSSWDEDRHVVRIARQPWCPCGQCFAGRTAKDVGRSFLHELRHCYQKEYGSKRGANFGSVYSVADSLYGYKANPFELDAEAWATEAIGRYPNIIEAC